MLWYRHTVKSGAEPNKFGVPGAALLPSTNVGDSANPTGAQIRALDFANTLRNLKYNMRFRSRQEITTDAKSVTMFLPLNAVLGSHRIIDTVMMGVKYTYIIERSSPDNYIPTAAAAAAGKFKIEHLFVWMPKVRPSLSGRTQSEALLVAGAQHSLYFEKVRVYRNQFGAAKLNPTYIFRYVIDPFQYWRRVEGAIPTVVVVVDGGPTMRTPDNLSRFAVSSDAVPPIVLFARTQHPISIG